MLRPPATLKLTRLCARSSLRCCEKDQDGRAHGAHHYQRKVLTGSHRRPPPWVVYGNTMTIDPVRFRHPAKNFADRPGIWRVRAVRRRNGDTAPGVNCSEEVPK